MFPLIGIIWFMIEFFPGRTIDTSTLTYPLTFVLFGLAFLFLSPFFLIKHRRKEKLLSSILDDCVELKANIKISEENKGKILISSYYKLEISFEYKGQQQKFSTKWKECNNVIVDMILPPEISYADKRKADQADRKVLTAEKGHFGTMHRYDNIEILTPVYEYHEFDILYSPKYNEIFIFSQPGEPVKEPGRN